MINALFDLLGTFYQSGEFAQAEWMAHSILQAIPDDLVSLQLLGLVYYRTRRRSEAMQAFSAAEGDVHTGPPAACMPRAVPAGCQRPWLDPGRSLVCAWTAAVPPATLPTGDQRLAGSAFRAPRFLSGAVRYCTHRKASRRQEFAHQSALYICARLFLFAEQLAGGQG